MSHPTIRGRRLTHAVVGCLALVLSPACVTLGGAKEKAAMTIDCPEGELDQDTPSEAHDAFAITATVLEVVLIAPMVIAGFRFPYGADDRTFTGCGRTARCHTDVGWGGSVETRCVRSDGLKLRVDPDENAVSPAMRRSRGDCRDASITAREHGWRVAGCGQQRFCWETSSSSEGYECLQEHQ